MSELVKHIQEYATKLYIMIGSFFGMGTGIVWSEYVDIFIKGLIGGAAGAIGGLIVSIIWKLINKKK